MTVKERIEEISKFNNCHFGVDHNHADFLLKHIKKLEAENKELRDAVELMMDHQTNCDCQCMDYQGIRETVLKKHSSNTAYSKEG